MSTLLLDREGTPRDGGRAGMEGFAEHALLLGWPDDKPKCKEIAVALAKASKVHFPLEIQVHYQAVPRGVSLPLIQRKIRFGVQVWKEHAKRIQG